MQPDGAGRLRTLYDSILGLNGMAFQRVERIKHKAAASFLDPGEHKSSAFCKFCR